MDAREQAKLRKDRFELEVEVGILKREIQIKESRMLSIDRQLGEYRDLHPAGSGRDTTGAP